MKKLLFFIITTLLITPVFSTEKLEVFGSLLTHPLNPDYRWILVIENHEFSEYRLVASTTRDHADCLSGEFIISKSDQEELFYNLESMVCLDQ